MLNWIVWIRTVSGIKMDSAINSLKRVICIKTQTNKQTNKMYYFLVIVKNKNGVLSTYPEDHVL